MAALNMSNELLRNASMPPTAAPAENAAPTDVDGADAQRRIRTLHAAIDQLMASQEKLF